MRYRQHWTDRVDLLFKPLTHQSSIHVSNKGTEVDSSAAGPNCSNSRPTTDAITTDADHVSPCYIVEAAIHLPYSAALIASLLFDYRRTVADALASPQTAELLTPAQIDTLLSFQNCHWIPTIRLDSFPVCE